MVPGYDDTKCRCRLKVGLGFGFDSRNDDFKVVRITYTLRPLTDKNTYTNTVVVDVYSLQSKSWRVTEGPVNWLTGVCMIGYSQCFVNETIHWPGWSLTNAYCIVAFNVEDEVFEKIEVPDSLSGYDYEILVGLRVDKCIDKLALIKKNSGGKVWSVWVMREYGLVDSWSKVFNVDLHYENLKPTVFSFMKTEEILILLSQHIPSERDRDRDSEHLMLLVGRNGQVNRVFGRNDGEQRSFWLGTYVGSLALFKER